MDATPHRDRSTPRLGQARDAERDVYRPLSGAAVAALVLGALSVVAPVDPWCWAIPLAGVVLGMVAIGRIARSAPAMAGRKIAVAGLGLSLAFGGVGVGHWTTTRYYLRHQARQFAEDWFTLLAKGQPQLAYQLTRPPGQRPPLDTGLWAYYRNDAKQRTELQEWVESPLVKTLLLLGDKATVRYCSTQQILNLEGSETVEQIFSVTFDDEKEGRKTFFVHLTLRRDARKRPDQVPWNITIAAGGLRPSWMGGENEPQA
ncbi:MAG: DUF4190 domain-containing protein [Pirellulales bacterium]|nr:DUF4190 domain-containing protein [Pirellulales bacterium]